MNLLKRTASAINGDCKKMRMEVGAGRGEKGLEGGGKEDKNRREAGGGGGGGRRRR